MEETPVQRTSIDVTTMKTQSKKEKLFLFLSILVIILFPLLLLFCFRVIKQYKRAIVLRFGKVRPDSPAGPGIIWIIPFTDDVTIFDLRTQSFHLPPQQILTKDSVTVTVDAVGYFHILKPIECLVKIQYHRYSTELLAIAILRNVLGQYTLAEALASRQSMSAKTTAEIDRISSNWGISMERVEIKNIQLPVELQAAMAVEAEATRIAKAKLIEANGEIKAAENLREAAKIVVENPQIMLSVRLRLKVNTDLAAPHAPQSLFVSGDENDCGDCGADAARKPQMHSQNITAHDRRSDATVMTVLTQSAKDTEQKLLTDPNTEFAQCTEIKKEKIFIEKLVVVLSFILVVILIPFSLFATFIKVRQFERIVILRNGKLRSQRVFGPGLVFYLPCIDSVRYIDLRIICYAVQPQEALTNDSLSISVDAVVYYKVFDPVLAVVRVTDYKQATNYISATNLRNALSSRNLSEILFNRRAVSQQVFENMKATTRKWGVQVIRVEIKDISLPLQLQKAMAAEAESSRLASAKITVAKAEIECTKSLQIATEMLMDNKWGMTLRYLQSLQTISGDKTHTILVPFSVETMNKLLK